MAIDFLERSDAIEECYEFLLGYAAQGLPSDQGSPAGREVRTHLEQARDALIGLPESCRQAIVDHQLEPTEKYDAFCSMLERDVRDSLVAIEMVTAMLCYIPVAHLADKHGQRPFVLATFVFFTLFPVSLLWAHNFAWLAAAFVVRGLKEFGEPARKALIIAQARPELRARTYGAYYFIRDCSVTTGSFLGAWLWSLSPQANFVGAAVCGALGTLWFWWFVSRQP